MSVTDPLADMLTRIRNGSSAKHEKVDIPASNLKEAIARILKDEGYIKNFKVIVDERKHGILRIFLKYDAKRRGIINLKRVSKPSRRVYVRKDEIHSVLKGLGISILSTSKGVLTDKEARKANVGGEVLCYVW
ncbi:MAG: 30S ribosomal protein S8 [Syntrophobacterales bacterium]|nr:MAG: 30S ribosomal protein S8 [Syntrophobacterales bacterium]